MIIKNFKGLATTKERSDALNIINSGINAVLVKPMMHQQIKISDNVLKIQNYSWNLSHYKKIYVVGAGKAAIDMAETIEEIFGKRISKGIVIDTRKKNLSRIKVMKGTHPLPSNANIKATKKIIELLEQSEKDDLIINLISGGGSALLFSSVLSLEKQIELNKQMLKRGSEIKEINTIRKHLSKVTGGQLAKLASPSTLISLIISDVITNDLDVIASGPTVTDKTTISDAKKIQKKYSLSNLPFIETPKEKIPNITNILLATNVRAAEAMKEKAIELGYNAKILSTQLKGEARTIGKNLAEMIKPNSALIATGETTVTVKGKGKGGRNQELVLSASKFIKEGVVVSCSSDGVDFITDAGGAIADEKTREIAKEKNLDTNKFLTNNDSYNFLKKVNGLIVTGKTGTNVGDLFLALGKRSKA